MIRRTTSRRSGASLVEVLVGFGILGIGVTSVITLFPFSALTLGQALRDDRTTTCAGMAGGQLRDIHTRYVVEPEMDRTKFGTVDGSREPYLWALDGSSVPASGSRALAPLAGLTVLSSAEPGPSYPVYIDPMGVAINPTSPPPVGDGGETRIPRVNLQLILNSGNTEAMSLRYCSLMDSLTFDEDGRVSSTANIGMRELRYNYAWMVQRPVNQDRYTLRMQVVVYNKRVHLYKPPGSEAVFDNVSFVPGETTIRNVPLSAEVRKGMWVMDAGRLESGLRHAEFYRITSVTEAAGGYALEVHKPISRADGLTGAGTNYTARLVVMPGVADVFERPNLTASTGP